MSEDRPKSSAPVAVTMRGIGKRYRLDGPQSQDSLAAVLERGLSRLRGVRVEPAPAPLGDRDFWALRGIDLAVHQGEVLGVLGRNGSGKSTLLKILARITPPTEGTAELHGRVAAMLEVGTGFHPDLTGRENAFLNGSILGLSRRRIAGRMDEIAAFAEIGRFLDVPVKHYSSGMFLRLAFSVLAHLEAEILLIDEITAVGDAGFERKSLAKLREMVGSGRTVLYISHDMQAVRSLCDRCIVLDRGRLHDEGDVERCIRVYEWLCRRGPLEHDRRAMG